MTTGTLPVITDLSGSEKPIRFHVTRLHRTARIVGYMKPSSNFAASDIMSG